MNHERIITSLCDLTGNALRPWAEAGWTCYAVDTQHAQRSDREERIGPGVIRYVWGDARSWTPPAPVAFGMAWTPCTDVCGSGAQDWQKKGLRKLTDALDLFNACYHALSWSGAPFSMENPVGAITRHFRKPDYTFDPWQYGDGYQKKTCLWTGNGFVMPMPSVMAKPADTTQMIHTMPPSAERANLRSATPMGFARAVYAANAPLLRAVA